MRSTVATGIAGALLVSVGLGWIGLTAGRLADGAASQSWPPVEGHVVVSQPVSRARDAGSPGWELRYRYAVDGAVYSGSRASYRGWPAVPERAYRAGQPVTVRVDPAAPHRAVLEPGFDAYNVALVSMGFLPIGLAALLALGVFVRRRIEADDAERERRLARLDAELRAVGEALDATSPAAEESARRGGARDTN